MKLGRAALGSVARIHDRLYSQDRRFRSGQAGLRAIVPRLDRGDVPAQERAALAEATQTGGAHAPADAGAAQASIGREPGGLRADYGSRGENRAVQPPRLFSWASRNKAVMTR